MMIYILICHSQRARQCEASGEHNIQSVILLSLTGMSLTYQLLFSSLFCSNFADGHTDQKYFIVKVSLCGLYHTSQIKLM